MHTTRPHFIFLLDAAGVVRSSNIIHPEYTTEHVIGRPFVAHICPGCRPCFERALTEALAGRTAQGCFVWDSPEGLLTLRCTLSPISLIMGCRVIGAASVEPFSFCPTRAAHPSLCRL